MAKLFIDETWKPAEYDEVVAAFVSAEAYRFGDRGIELTDQQRQCITQPDTQNPRENEVRHQLLLMLGRDAILSTLPPDTVWNEVRFLRGHQLNRNIFVLFDLQRLELQANRPVPFRDPPDKWGRPILWGHTKEGPFTILEGNTRLTQAAAYHSRDFNIPVLVGLSTNPCGWHTPDQFGVCSLHPRGL